MCEGDSISIIVPIISIVAYANESNIQVDMLLGGFHPRLGEP